MRRVAEPERIERFMTALAGKATQPARLYFTGGATAVLMGWRASTIDVDIHIIPDDDRLLRALPELKEDLEMNVELVPELYRYPAIDPPAYRRAVEKMIADINDSAEKP